MKNEKLKMKSVFLFFVIGALLLPLAARAEWRWSAQGSGETVTVTLALAPDAPVNALSGEVTYSGPLALLGIEEADSIVPLWTVRPSESDQRIVFEGVIPGGFEGIYLPGTDRKAPGPVVTMVFERSGPEPAVLVARGTVFLHDGEGTSMELPLARLDLGVPAAIGSPAIRAPDLLPPEPFSPAVGSDPDLFRGEWFVSWSASDKGSSIESYEVLETRSGRTAIGAWQPAESPFLLRDQSRKSFIRVKAIDRAGNERIAVLSPAVPRTWHDYLVLQLVVALTIAGVVAGVIRKKT